MKLTHLDHATLIVTDAAQAREFYGTGLGLREIAPPKEFDFPAIWYDLGGQYLHLLVKPEPDTPSPRHICFCTPDAAEAREHFRKLGISTSETVKIAAADRFFVTDPDGNRVELLQWQRPYHPESDGRVSG